MAGSVNKVILIGNLGADPEVRSFQNGGKVANLRIATSETWRDKSSGERRKDGSNSDGLMLEDNMPVHPNEKGHRRMAEIFTLLLSPPEN